MHNAACHSRQTVVYRGDSERTSWSHDWHVTSLRMSTSGGDSWPALQVLMMRRRQDGNGEDESMDPMSEYTNTPDMGTSPPALPATLAEANPPAARNHNQPQPPAAPAPPRQPLSVDIPTRDSLPEHRIQVCL